MSDYNYAKLLALMKVVPAYPAAAVAFRDVETIVHEQHARLATLEKDRDEWKRSSELVARVLIDTKADLTAARVVVEAGVRLHERGAQCGELSRFLDVLVVQADALAAMKDKPKVDSYPTLKT